jgi:integrase
MATRWLPAQVGEYVSAKLTEAKIASLKANGRDQWFNDGQLVRGHGQLALRVGKGGAKRWYFKYTNLDGGRITMPIGAHHPKGDGLSTFTLLQARTKVSALAATQAEVGDLREHQQAERRRLADERRQAELAAAEAARLAAAQSFRRLIQVYCDRLDARGRRSAAEVRGSLNLHVLAVPDFADLLDRRARDVTKTDIVAILGRVHTTLKAKDPNAVCRQMNKVRSHLHAMFSMGVSAELDPILTGSGISFALEHNPVSTIRPDRTANRAKQRVLSAAEFGHFWIALDGEPEAIRDAIRLSLLLGGQRSAQLVRLQPKDVDLEQRMVTLYDGKGARSQARVHSLPLSDAAAEIVGRMMKRTAGRPYIVSTTGHVPLHGSTVSNSVAGIAKEMVTAKTATALFSANDAIRRSCETFLAALGVSSDVRAQIQSHGLSGVQLAHYNMHGYLPEKRDALERWSVRIAEMVAAAKGSNVLQFPEIAKA